MFQAFITTIFLVIALYLLCGLLFSVVFLTKGIHKLDEGAHGTGIGFRLIILPGCLVFWPVLLRKWRMTTRQNKPV